MSRLGCSWKTVASRSRCEVWWIGTEEVFVAECLGWEGTLFRVKSFCNLEGLDSSGAWSCKLAEFTIDGKCRWHGGVSSPIAGDFRLEAMSSGITETVEFGVYFEVFSPVTMAQSTYRIWSLVWDLYSNVSHEHRTLRIWLIELFLSGLVLSTKVVALYFKLGFWRQQVPRLTCVDVICRSVITLRKESTEEE